MVRRCLAYAAAVAGLSAAASLTSAEADNGAVIELFTSQGCSSCPAADALLDRIAAEPNTVAITLAIDVWDYLGWKDTLADPRNTVRWKAYSKSRGDRQVYTPQAVINGAEHALGSDRSAIDKAITKSRKHPQVMSVSVRLEGRQVTIVGDPGIGAAVDVVVVGLARAVTVMIQRGENKGRTVTYHNVVRSWERLESWNGKPGSFPLPALKRDGVDATAVLVQASNDGMPGAILGAAVASLR